MRGIQSIGADRWRKSAIVAASLAFHAVVLGYIALATIGDPRRYGEPSVIDDPLFSPPILVQLEPRPVMRGETARTRAVNTPDRSMQPIPDTGARQSETTGATGSADPGDRPSPPAPRYAPAAGTGVAAPPAAVGSAQWRVRPETLGDRVGRGLRTGTVGCASPNLLTDRERAICDDRFGERAAAAAPIEGTGNPERDARFAREGARALAEYEGRRRPLSGGSGLIGSGDCPGSNFGIGCAGAYLPDVPGVDIRQGATTTHNGGQRSDKQQR